MKIEQEESRDINLQKSGERGLLVAVFCVLLGVSVVVNVFLARTVSSLRSRLTAESSLRIGARAPSIVGSSPDGAKQILDYRQATVPTVLYVFTPQCGWCKKNLANLRELIAHSGPNYRLIGISLTRQDLQEYLSKEKLEFTVITDIDAPTLKAYHLGATPTTIIISPEGKVLKTWVGVYEDPVRKQIENSLKISLPGCCEQNAEDKKTQSGIPTALAPITRPSGL